MILVVDDEEKVRSLLVRLLSEAGHSTHECTEAREALRFYQSNQPQIDLVVLDLLMPSMSGHSLLQSLLRLNPALKILVVSGSTSEAMDEAERLGARAVLRKPFKPEDFLDTVRQVLSPSG